MIPLTHRVPLQLVYPVLSRSIACLLDDTSLWYTPNVIVVPLCDMGCRLRLSLLVGRCSLIKKASLNLQAMRGSLQTPSLGQRTFLRSHITTLLALVSHVRCIITPIPQLSTMERIVTDRISLQLMQLVTRV